MMLPTIRKTQLTGWLRKAPKRLRRQADGAAASTVSVVSSADTTPALPQKNLLVLLLLLGKQFGVKIVHFDKLNFVGVRERWIDTFSIHELTEFSDHRHILATEKIIDEGFAGVGMGRLVTEG